MSSLGPAFDYSPSVQRSRPLAPRRLGPGANHAATPSLSSTTSSRSNRSSYTSYTSSYCSYRDTDHEPAEGDDDDEESHRSILEDLLENLETRPQSSSTHARTTSTDRDFEASPPRVPERDWSHLRERTRYRSSASIQPLASAPSHSTMDLSAFLASLPPSLDKCFCGKDVEEDSIYCSRLCAQEDALNALCGASSGAEDSDRASLVSGSSSSASGESHYRRVEREEVRREKERQAKLARERAVARRRAREGESVSSAGSTGSKKGSLWRSHVDVGSVKNASTSSSSSNRVGTPSLSSSVSSLASTSSACSPISPSFPPPQATNAHLTTPVILAPPPRPITPAPSSPPRDVSDIYSSYLATTPLAPSSSLCDSKLLRTPRQNDGSTPRSAYPQTPYDDDDEEEDDSPTGRAARIRAQQQHPAHLSSGGGGGGGGLGACGMSDVGLRMLELCSSYPSSPSEDFLSESLDQVYPDAAPSLGWGHREMQERMNRKQGRAGPASSGHTKGKLSFEDVVGILGA
ncbi:hypothetical protein JCM3766R1_004868 [Sporobolomyces carnicolor]